MLESLAAGMIVAIAALLLGRGYYRSAKSRKSACACGETECPVKGACNHLQPHVADVDGGERCTLATSDLRSPGVRG